MNRFDQKLKACGSLLTRRAPEILQVNLGKLCNLTCVHCHVEAGPSKTRENMDGSTAKQLLRLMDWKSIHILDLTGGAPEMNPHFKFLVSEAFKRKLHIIDRCNLTVFFLPGYTDLPEFLQSHQVEVTASLPCYSPENVDKQRGSGTFSESIEALKRLNALGYGVEDTGLVLNLVYNPVGPHLPPEQSKLQEQYKKRLAEDFGIRFNRLYTITNMPITRYEKYLRAFHQYDDYIRLLEHNFNPETLTGLMCLNTLSIAWDGTVYDCDFNQALKIPLAGGAEFHIRDLTEEDAGGIAVRTGEHCFGCTAGAGSSCQGALQSA